jgi:hypothetical protein
MVHADDPHMLSPVSWVVVWFLFADLSGISDDVPDAVSFMLWAVRWFDVVSGDADSRNRQSERPVRLMCNPQLGIVFDSLEHLS